MKCQLECTTEIEEQMFPLERLKAMWKLPNQDYPDSIDINKLILLRQLHDTISLVSLSGSSHQERFIFKSTVSNPKYMYHELKLLLTMPSHSGIMPKPLYLVTSADSSGTEKLFGFILPYFRNGSLADALCVDHGSGRPSLADKYRWAIEMAETLKVINTSPASFFSELKVDNLLLSDDGSVVFIDFEQSGKLHRGLLL
jgi:hypothetical protein